MRGEPRTPLPPLLYPQSLRMRACVCARGVLLCACMEHSQLLSGASSASPSFAAVVVSDDSSSLAASPSLSFVSLASASSGDFVENARVLGTA